MVAVAAMFTFAACGGDDTTDPAPKPGSKTQLAKPVVKVTANEEGSFTITWDAIPNATKYLVYLKEYQPQSTETTETTYTFTDLNAGTYKPRVKALGGGNYKDSEYSDAVDIVVTGVTSVEWFTQTLRLPEDNAENDAKGMNSSNTVLFNWKGTDVETIKFIYYPNTEKNANLKDEDIIASLTADYDYTSLYIKDINSEKGVDLQVGNLAGNTEYVFAAYVVKGNQTFLDKKTIKTTETKVTIGTKAWLGSWDAYSPQTVTLSDAATSFIYTFADVRTDYTLNITLYDEENYSDYVWVDGFSSVGAEGVPAFGIVSHGENGEYTLDLMCFEAVAELGEDLYAMWMPICSIGGGKYNVVLGQFKGFTLTMAADGTITCTPYSSKLDGGNMFEVVALDVFAIDMTTYSWGILQTQDEDGTTTDILTYKAGGILGVTKAQAPATTASCAAPKAFKASALPASVVVAM